MSTPALPRQPPNAAQEHPWAVWNVVSGWSGGFLRRGRPPLLKHPNVMGRIFRITLVMLVLGLLAGWADVLISLLRNWTGLARGLTWQVHVAIRGLFFGLFVLVPMSRWQGRNWWLAALAVPVSMLFRWGFEGTIHLTWREMPMWQLMAWTGCVAAFPIGLWMIGPRCWRDWGFVALTVLAGIAGQLLRMVAISSIGLDPHPWLPESLQALLIFSYLVVPFNCTVAAALGLRLALEPAPPPERAEFPGAL